MGDNMITETRSSKETYELGYNMGKNARAGDVYCLDGDLGVGKTVFTQGFAKGLGIRSGRWFRKHRTHSESDIYDRKRI